MSEPPPETTDATTRPPLRAAVGLGLGIAGVVCLAVAALVLGADLAVPAEGRTGLRLFAAIAVLAAVWMLYEREAVAARPPLDTWWSDRSLAVSTVIALAASLAAAVWSLLGVLDQAGQGFVGHVTVTGLVGGLALSAGTALGLGRPVPRGLMTLDLRRGGLVLAGGAVTAALVVPLSLTAPDWTLTSTTAPSRPVLATPSSVSREAWTLALPSETTAGDVISGGPGVLVREHDGVVGVDATTGRVVWTYRRSGAYTVAVDVTPDGRHALLELSPNSGPDVLVGLDAVTGAQTFTSVLTGRVSQFRLSNTAFVTTTAAETVLEGRSITTGRALWRFVPAGGCSIYGSYDLLAATPHAITLPIVCGRTKTEGPSVHFAGLDPTTGRTLWQGHVGISDPTNVQVGLLTSPDGSAVEYYLLGSGGATREYFFEPSTGAKLHRVGTLEPGARGWASGSGAKAPQLIDMRTGAVLSGDTPTVGCVRFGGVLLRSGTVCRGLSTDSATVKRFVRTGRWPVQVAGLHGAASHVDVDLGGPYRDQDLAPLAFVAGRGVVVVASNYPAAVGGTFTIAGLR